MIRLATDADWETIPEIHRLAFGDEGDDVARLVGELRASQWYKPALSFVAEEDGAVVGHGMNTWNWLEGGSPRVLQLSPLGVLPEYQRRGHGSALVRASLDAVRAIGEPLLLPAIAAVLKRKMVLPNITLTSPVLPAPAPTGWPADWQPARPCCCMTAARSSIAGKSSSIILLPNAARILVAAPNSTMLP